MLEKTQSGEHALSKIQQSWLVYCLMGIVLTNTVCWRAFERVGLGEYRVGALSWMFRKGKIAWDGLLRASVDLLLKKYHITEAVLVIDDTDHRRAKKTSQIWKAQKIYDKKTGGYFNGQSLVFLILVTPKITIPVGFRFYQADPDLVAWKKEDNKLKKSGVKKKDRPVAPTVNPNYPSKPMLAQDLVKTFSQQHPTVKIKAITADALYGSQEALELLTGIKENVQVISQLQKTQLVKFRGKEYSLAAFFKSYAGVPQRIRIRGGEEVEAIIGSARLHVCAHNKKRFVIALKYPGETEYRFLVATDLSWRTIDIVQAYTLRWLIEVFFEDWKLYEGWEQMTKQPGEEGSSRSLILSLLLDHALFLHPEQSARIENKLPACTVGSLIRHIQGEAFIHALRSLVDTDDFTTRIDEFSEKVKTWFKFSDSKKHMNHREIGRLDPSPSLIYWAKTA